MKRNLFKSVWDGLFYLVLYFVVPCSQLIAYFILDDSSVWFVSLLMTASLTYDSYTRFNPKRIQSFRKKVIMIGSVSLLLSVYSLSLIIIMAAGVAIDGKARLPYVLLSFPLTVALYDFYCVFNHDVSKERRTE